MNSYKVCILAAGVGSRMFNFTKEFNKVLIPIQGKPTICHIIEKFPKDIEIVIAVGYKKDGIINYLLHSYPDRKLAFVDVGKFEGPGSGPGYSLLQCKPYLQCPFIQFAGDTLVREEIPAPDTNWFGVAEVSNTERFLSVKIEDSKVVRMDDKKKTDNKYAFIGLAGVYDYEHFWKALETNKTLVANEIQVANGFNSLIEKNMGIKVFTWFDTGTPESYAYALNNYQDDPSYSEGLSPTQKSVNQKPNFVIDVDGVMTTGQFLYSADGKTHKVFGPHDSDGLKMIKNKVNIVFITADKRGFPISEKRIKDMGYPIELVTEGDRYNYIKNKFGFENTFYMGDGIFDAPLIKECRIGIAPANARQEAKEAADFVTASKSAEGAVCDACIEILKRISK